MAQRRSVYLCSKNERGNENLHSACRSTSLRTRYVSSNSKDTLGSTFRTNGRRVLLRRVWNLLAKRICERYKCPWPHSVLVPSPVPACFPSFPMERARVSQKIRTKMESLYDATALQLGFVATGDWYQWNNPNYVRSRWPGQARPRPGETAAVQYDREPLV